MAATAIVQAGTGGRWDRATDATSVCLHGSRIDEEPADGGHPGMVTGTVGRHGAQRVQVVGRVMARTVGR